LLDMSVTRKVRLPTPEEDAAINAGIASDPDTVELTEEEFAELEPLRRRGGVRRKVETTVLPDQEVFDAFLATGRGWQSRLNQALREWLDQHSRSRSS
jgi:uncharacterized protein (DUF4415 family)